MDKVQKHNSSIRGKILLVKRHVPKNDAPAYLKSLTCYGRVDNY